MKFFPFLATLVIIFLFSCNPGPDNRLNKATREDKNGWIYVHLEGSPETIGYQHGYLLADEIDTTIQAVAYWLQHETHYNWQFYRDAAKDFLWGKIDREYKDEINGIVSGLRAKNKNYDSLDVTAYNALEELAFYYVPEVMNAARAHSGDNKAPGNCSAFIATGSYTRDGKIVMAHNNWTEYIWGQHWNVVADIVPASGNHLMMDCMPGFIHSGDDFVITANGMLITETTITQFLGFDSTAIPEFVRARKASQYSNSIDDVIKIFTTGNNGGYANDWLIGDTKTNEVAKLELGLKYSRVWRSKDTAMIGSNFPSDPTLIAKETTFNTKDSTTSPNARKRRMEQLVIVDLKGKLDVESGEQVEADHKDVLQNKNANNRCVICGHIEEDPKGCPEWDCKPFDPMGAVQGKITTAELAGKMQFWAHMGHPCGESFIGEQFYKLHPEYEWQSKYLKNMIAYPWTLFTAKP
ncbi:MAG TPA: C45 family autoproteolytic acyltransferase/hydrolase [Puia sp.]|nr:C45 family autoproteolytic acyltransferase/hydrolase [Puia sp.]